MTPAIDLAGKRFGKLLVGYRATQNTTWGRPQWVCRCDCGYDAIVSRGNLVRGFTKSCGCLRRERAESLNFKHGQARAVGQTVEFKAWTAIKERCLNVKSKQFSRYGGRGIVICDRWLDDFAAFLADMGPRPTPTHSIDRIDNMAGYFCGKVVCKTCGGHVRQRPNCRWATKKQQGRNRRTNRVIEHAGCRLTMTEWSEVLGIKRATLDSRFHNGWTTEQALTMGATRSSLMDGMSE